MPTVKAVFLICAFIAGSGIASAEPFVATMHGGPGGTPTVDVAVDGAGPRRFIVDLAAGPMLLRGAPPGNARFLSYFTGFRMTGARMDTALYHGPKISFGPITSEGQPVAYWPDMDPSVVGMLPASFFATTSLTMDYVRRRIVVEDDASFAQRIQRGAAVNVAIDTLRNVISSVYVNMDLGNGQRGQCLLDTGQFNIQVNKRYMKPLLRQPGDLGVTEEGDHFIAHLPRVAVADAESIAVTNPKVIFRDIIYDCVVGNAFWSDDKTFTLDLAHRMLYVDQAR